LGVDFTLIDEVCCEAVKNETGSVPNPERIRENIERMKGIGGQEVLFLCPTCLKTFLEYDEKDRTGLVFKPFLSYLRENFSFTPLESPAIYGGDNINKASIPYRKGGVKTPSFLTGFTSSETDPATITYHDPCHLGRGLGSFDGARELLEELGSKWVEMEHHHRESLCCGAGGGVRAFYPKFSRDIARRRVKEAEEVKAEILLTDCLSCKHNLKQGIPWEGKMRVMTTPEYLLEKIESGKIQFSRKTTPKDHQVL
jgi:Fe-S oxidoreductase